MLYAVKFLQNRRWKNINESRKQTGYVSSRYIGEAARSILDIMDYTKTYDIPGLLLFIDFEKGFDNLKG